MVRWNSASARRIHEFQFHVFADALDVVVGPIFVSVGLRLTAAEVQRPVTVLALGVAFERIRLAIHDVDAAAVGSPAWHTRRKMLVGVGDAAIVLFLYGVVDRIGVGIAPLPELLDKLLALFVGLQLQEGFALRIGDDVGDVFVQPLLVRRGEFL